MTCAQRRLRSAWPSAQYDHSESSLCAHWVAEDPIFFMRTWQTLIRLARCLRWSHMSFCWFCHAAAQTKDLSYLFHSLILQNLSRYSHRQPLPLHRYTIQCCMALGYIQKVLKRKRRRKNVKRLWSLLWTFQEFPFTWHTSILVLVL